MKHNVTVYFLDGTNMLFENVDRVDLLSEGGGILSVIEDKTNNCFPMHFIERYVIEDVVTE